MLAQTVYRPYYTKSAALVNYMIRMLAGRPGMRVLEPCAGDGVLIEALLENIPGSKVDAYELDPDAFIFLKKKYQYTDNLQIKHADAIVDDELTLLSKLGGSYDRIIANPPYGGWQDYKKRKDLKRLYPAIYVKETYALFLHRCTKLLTDGGRLVFIIPDTFLNLHMHTGLRKYLLTHMKIKEIALFSSSFFPNVNFGYSNLSIITLEKSQSEDDCLNNQFRVLTGFKNVEDLENPENRSQIYSFSQKEVYNHLDHAFFISNNTVNVLLNSSNLRIGDIADCVTGIYSGNDKRYLRPISLEAKNSKKYVLINRDLICSNYGNKVDILDGVEDATCYIPVMKGGSVKYIKQDIWYLDWSKDAVKAYKTDKKARFQNSQYYFKYGIGIPMVSSSQMTAALIENKLFDQSIVGVFPKDPRWIYYLLAFFNSPTCNKLLRTINPSANNSANYIKKIPFILPDKDTLEFINEKIGNIVAALKAGYMYDKEDEMLIHNQIAEIYKV